MSIGGKCSQAVSLSLKGLFLMSKVDVYQSVTDSIVAKLEAGVNPWAPQWKNAAVSRPLRSCGTPYTGVNVIVLWIASIESGYSSPFWMTYKQAEELGGQVRKGEKSTRVVFFQILEKEKTSASGEKSVDKIPMLKTYCVFNASQIDGLPARFYPAADASKVNTGERLAVVDEWARATGAEIVEGGNRACYSPSLDRVSMPAFDQFESPEAFASVLAHELVHWSGAPGRLARDLSGRFGDSKYAAEELIAELGAAFVMADLGVCSVPRDDHASYLAAWLKIMKADKRAIFTASSMACKAAEFLGSFAGAAVESSEEIPAGV